MSDKLQISRRTLLGIGGAAAVAYPFSNPFAAFASPQAAGTGALKVDKDVVVGKAGDKDLLVDVYHPPAGTEKHMALVHLHGGGFAGGTKEMLAGQVTPITMRGYTSVCLAYTLDGVAKWPAQINDAKTAIRWTRENASSLGIDPNHIAVNGYSAGGLIALVAAGSPDTQVAACVTFYPVSHPNSTDPGIVGLLGPGADAATFASANPPAFIKAGHPPTIIYHGLADTTVAPENSFRLLGELRDAKVTCELHTFNGVVHVFDRDPAYAQLCAPITDFFLDRYVLNPQPAAPPRPAGGGGGQGPATAR